MHVFSLIPWLFLFFSLATSVSTIQSLVVPEIVDFVDEVGWFPRRGLQDKSAGRLLFEVSTGGSTSWTWSFSGQTLRGLIFKEGTRSAFPHFIPYVLEVLYIHFLLPAEITFSYLFSFQKNIWPLVTRSTFVWLYFWVFRSQEFTFFGKGFGASQDGRPFEGEGGCGYVLATHYEGWVFKGSSLLWWLHRYIYAIR